MRTVIRATMCPLLAAIACLAAAGSARAVPSFMSGEQLYEFCRMTDKQACNVYVAGIIDARRQLEDATGAEPVFCLPERIDIEELGYTVLRFLTQNQSDRQYSAASMVVSAVADVYPCPAPGPR